MHSSQPRARARLSCWAAFLVLGLAAGGCGGDEQTPADATAPPPPSNLPVGTPTCDGAEPVGSVLATTPGTPRLESPTFEHLTAVWEIEGDEDEDATVLVRVRPEGGEWSHGLALRRVPAGTLAGASWPNRFSGSLFGLEPGTAYEVELFLSDPDGGCAVERLPATTRLVPEPVADATATTVTPSSFASHASGAAPGEVLELSPGQYPAFKFMRDGSASAPIVIRGGADATIDGDVDLSDRRYVILDGVTINGGVRLDRAFEVAVTRTTIHTAADGISIRGGGGENAYIADNVIEGPTDWKESALGASGDNRGEGIVINGSGHVVEHNTVSGFADGISLADAPTDLTSVDILRNDLSAIGDDAIEADYCEHDCRIEGNRITNAFIGLSSQPGLGGPTYFVRNAIYNTIAESIKLHNGTIGDVIIHNTVVKNGTALGVYRTEPFSRQLLRNNLFLGGPGGTYNGWSSGSRAVIDLPSAAPTVDMDYDGFGTTLDRFIGRIGTTWFAGIEELRQRTTEAHAVEVDLDVFAADVPYPASPFPALAPPDLGLAPGSAAVDAGIAIPGLNDEFSGAAPDLGAYEFGQELPEYGARD